MEKLFDEILAAWKEFGPRASTALECPNLATLAPCRIVQFKENSIIIVNKDCDDAISRMSFHFLHSEKMEYQFSYETINNIFLQEFFAFVENQDINDLNVHSFLSSVKRHIARKSRQDAVYAVPVIVAPRSLNTDFSIGNIRILSKSIFSKYISNEITEYFGDLKNGKFNFINSWREYSRTFDHVFLIPISNAEAEKGWENARICALFVLNIIRLWLGFSEARDLKIGDHTTPIEEFAEIVLINERVEHLSYSTRFIGGHLEDGWDRRFITENGHLLDYTLILCQRVASSTFSGDPILERLIFFQKLINLSFTNSDSSMRLVQLVAAIETLAAIDSYAKQKKQIVSKRASKTAGCDDSNVINRFSKIIQDAYDLRNLIVHGEGCHEHLVIAALRNIDEILMKTVSGFFRIYKDIEENSSPKTTDDLKKAIKNLFERI